MSEYETCRVCGSQADLKHTGARRQVFDSNPRNWKYYCSRACKYSEQWKGLAGIGVAFSLFLVFYMMVNFGESRSDFLIILFISSIFGSSLFIPAIYQRSIWLK